MGDLAFLGWCVMNLKAFQGRYAGLVSLAKTVGILLLVINLASAFVLERCRIARTAIEVEELEKEVKQLRKKRAYLQSSVSNLESLERLGSIAVEVYSLKLPHPNRILWLSELDLPVSESGSIVLEAVDRLDFLYASLVMPNLGRSSASAGERITR